jgi:hypothetical protein
LNRLGHSTHARLVSARRTQQFANTARPCRGLLTAKATTITIRMTKNRAVASAMPGDPVLPVQMHRNAAKHVITVNAMYASCAFAFKVAAWMAVIITNTCTRAHMDGK